MKNNEYIKREIVLINFLQLPFGSSNSIEIKEWENIMIRFPEKKMVVDIGALCFGRRRKISTQNDLESSYEVDIDSLMLHRVIQIKRILEEWYFELKIENKNEMTIYTLCSSLMNFLNWCDERINNYLVDLDSARDGLIMYGYEQIHLYQSEVNKIQTSNQKYNSAKIAVSIMMDVNPNIINQGLPVILAHDSDYGTESVSDIEIETYQNICKTVFRGLYDLVINEKKYPYKINILSETTHLFPSSIPIITDHNKSKVKGRMNAYNYKEGRVNKLSEIKDKFIKNSYANTAIHNAIKVIDDSNFDMNCYYRVIHASLAMQSFLSMVLIEVPMNLSVISNVEWNEVIFNKDNKSIRFTAIKPRAGYKEVSFLLPSSLKKDFNKFLKLREYLIDIIPSGENVDTLFFNIQITKQKLFKASKINGNFSYQINNRFKNYFGNEIPLITTRQFRSSIADNLVNSIGPIKASKELQNSLSTTLKYYTAGSKIKTAEELTLYFELLNGTILNTKNNLVSDTPSGKCENIGKPVKTNDGLILNVNCRQFEGCLFCEHYKVMSDEKDIRKLTSMKYVIIQTKYLSSSISHFNNIYGDLLERVDELLLLISKKSTAMKSLVERIYYEVNDDEILSNHWERKLKLLIDLEVLT